MVAHATCREVDPPPFEERRGVEHGQVEGEPRRRDRLSVPCEQEDGLAIRRDLHVFGGRDLPPPGGAAGRWARPGGRPARAGGEEPGAVGGGGAALPLSRGGGRGGGGRAAARGPGGHGRRRAAPPTQKHDTGARR